MFAVKTLFATLLFLIMSMFFGVMLLPWLYLPLVAFLYFRPLYKVAVWLYVGLISITLLQMLAVSSIYPKQYQSDTDIYFYGGLPITPLFLYDMQLSSGQNCRSANEQQPCGYQLNQWLPLSPTANCTLSLDQANTQLLHIRAKASLCLLTRIPTKTGSSIIVDVTPSIFTLHTAFIFSAAVLLGCLLLLNNIRQSYRVPLKTAE
jgi:hypothetical protein